MTILTNYKIIKPQDKYDQILRHAWDNTITIPSIGRQDIERGTMRQLVKAGLIDLTIQGISFSGEQDEFSLLNWADPTTFEAVPVSSPTHTPGEGWRSDGSSSYLESGLTVGDVIQNNISIATSGIDDSAVDSRAKFGVSEGGLVWIRCTGRSAANQFRYQLSNSTLRNISGITDNRSRIIITRNGDSTSFSENGGTYSTDASGYPYSAISNGALKIFLLAQNINAVTVNNYDSRGLKYFWVFNQEISQTMATKFDTIIQTLL